MFETGRLWQEPIVGTHGCAPCRPKSPAGRWTTCAGMDLPTVRSVFAETGSRPAGGFAAATVSADRDETASCPELSDNGDRHDPDRHRTSPPAGTSSWPSPTSSASAGVSTESATGPTSASAWPGSRPSSRPASATRSAPTAASIGSAPGSTRMPRSATGSPPASTSSSSTPGARTISTSAPSGGC